VRRVTGKADTCIEEDASELDQFRRDSRRNLFRSIAIFCRDNGPTDGYYMEFGCHTARTMRLAWDVCHHEHNWTYVGFDSFEGLPEIQEIDKMPIWQKGSCATSEQGFLQ
jgi:O-methyltransferase